MIAEAAILSAGAALCTAVVASLRLARIALEGDRYHDLHPLAPEDAIGLHHSREYCPLCHRSTPVWIVPGPNGVRAHKCVECHGDPDTARAKQRMGKEAYL